MVRKALVLGVLLAGLVGALIAVLPSEAAPAAVGETITLSITEVGTGLADSSADAGQQVTMRVIATSTQAMAALQFVIEFDNTVAQIATGGLDHSLLTGGFLFIDNGAVANTKGELSIALVSATAPGTSGYIIVDITFDLVGSAGDSSALTFSAVLASDASNVQIPVTLVNGSITLTPAAANDSYSTDEDTALSVNAATGVLANDVDDAALTAVKVTDPANGTLTVPLNADGSFTYTPNANFNGVDSFTYKANDGTNDSNIATVNITVNAVNDAPVANDDVGATNEDTQLSVNAADGVLANDTDVDTGDTRTVTAFDAVSASGATVSVAADGSYTYDPTPSAALQALSGGETLDDTFTYTIEDGDGASDTATVTVTVTGVNDAPVANNDTFGTDEDTPLNIAAAGVLANDTDAETDTLTVTAFDAVSTSGAAVSVSADGSFTYDPTGSAVLQDLFSAAESIDDTFTYTISDGNGGADTATVTVTVTGINDLPVAGDDVAATDEDTPLNVAAPGVLANDTDAENDALTITAFDAVSANGAAVAVAADGSFSYDPTASAALQALAAGDSIDDTFTYTIDDGQAGSDTATVTVTVSGVNDAPVANNDDNVFVTEDTPKNIDVLANDTDADADDTLTVVGIATTTAASQADATIVIETDGTITYTPPPGFLGADEFDYSIQDSTGLQDMATVSLTVVVNQPPVAVNDTGATDEDTVLTDGTNVLDNDSDPENETITVVKFDAASSNGATVDVQGNGSYTYDPTGSAVLQDLSDGESLDDTFTYTVEDASGGQTVATVTITVTGINDVPVAFDDAGATDEDTVLNVAAAQGVLANDTDAENDPLTVTAFDAASVNGAVLDIMADGSYTYDPTAAATLQALAAGESIEDTFGYTMTDNVAGSDSATVTITVSGVNDPPTVASAIADVSVLEDADPTVIDLSGIFADVDNGDSVTLLSADNTNPVLLSATITGTELTLVYVDDQ
ncbi:MAG: tandem-95 repeat protein, partial [Acidobacteria bacterium]|nr:tandem-95 repeat protein [Acidobacteriota bacterium]